MKDRVDNRYNFTAIICQVTLFITFSAYREFGIPGEKMNEIQKQFIRMTSSENPSTRWAAVWALGRLNVHRKDAYLSLVRRLVDDDKDTRKQATKVLKDLTGISR